MKKTAAPSARKAGNASKAGKTKPKARKPSRQTKSKPSKSKPSQPTTARTGSSAGSSASQLIDARIDQLGDWRGQMLGRLRALIKEADPGVVEDWKWEVPTWYHAGLICTGETYKQVVKMTFAKGAALEDPSGLFNSSLGGNIRRAIDVREGEAIDETALKALVRAAVALNQASAKR